MGFPANEDWNGVLRVPLTFSASDIHIVGVILYVLGNLGMKWVGDMDGVIVAAVWVIENEPKRWSIRVILLCLSFIVNCAFLIFFDGKCVGSQLRSERTCRGVVVNESIIRN